MEVVSDVRLLGLLYGWSIHDRIEKYDFGRKLSSSSLRFTQCPNLKPVAGNLSMQVQYSNLRNENILFHVVETNADQDVAFKKVHDLSNKYEYVLYKF